MESARPIRPGGSPAGLPAPGFSRRRRRRARGAASAVSSCASSISIPPCSRRSSPLRRAPPSHVRPRSDHEESNGRGRPRGAARSVGAPAHLGRRASRGPGSLSPSSRSGLGVGRLGAADRLSPAAWASCAVRELGRNNRPCSQQRGAGVRRRCTGRSRKRDHASTPRQQAPPHPPRRHGDAPSPHAPCGSRRTEAARARQARSDRCACASTRRRSGI